MDSATLRLLDANLNRAREALRVMEEYARFVMNDGSISAVAKALRHDLAESTRSTPLESPFRARDIVGDVGTDIETVSEYERRDALQVAVAAGKRLSESLRCLEEYAKVDDVDLARKLEALRYRGYELERRFLMTVDAVNRFAHVRVYVILTESECRTEWLETARAAINGGADCLQLREKHLSDRELLERARRLADLCRAFGVLCIVNDRPDIAILSGAHGVHVGQDDVSVAEARRIVGPNLLVGVSTHTPSQLAAAAASTPDYIAVGPIFDTALKPGSTPLGLEAIRDGIALTAIPIVPIGGIDPEGATRLARVGAQRVCVCRGVIGSDDPSFATAALRRAVVQSSFAPQK